MPRTAIRRALVLGSAAALGVALAGPRKPLESCVPGPARLDVCPASELARPTDRGPVPLELWAFDPATRTVRLDAARDETVAFQLVLRAPARRARVEATVEVGDLVDARRSRIAAGDAVRRFLALPVWVEPGRHRWGVPSPVLPWPAAYHDALVPLEPGCREIRGHETHLPRSVSCPRISAPAGSILNPVPAGGTSTVVWVDVWVPPSTAPGRYRGPIVVRVGRESVRLSLALRVYEATLPAVPSLRAMGELYRAYDSERLGRDRGAPGWQRMARCVQQLAHRHRVVLVEREAGALGPAPAPFEADAWADYAAAHAGALDGTLFTEREGYRGPGAGTPVPVWRVPWPERAYRHIEPALGEEEIDRYRALARAWAEQASTRGWDRTRFVAYLFDEVDTPQDTADAAALDPAVVRRAHEQMRRVQQALDEGASDPRIDLLWVGQADPAAWVAARSDPVSALRAWVPAAATASPAFLAARARAGEEAWFYHGGHPFLGIHTVNASGIELRSWGVIAARYRLTGHLMWAADYGHPTRPYEMPSYASDDDRFGNGLIVYPGTRLDAAGLAPIAEPVPSVRLKAWRAGVQDADLAHLGRAAGHAAAVDRVLRALVPRALADGIGRAAWPSEGQAWQRAHHALLVLASAGATE